MSLSPSSACTHRVSVALFFVIDIDIVVDFVVIVIILIFYLLDSVCFDSRKLFCKHGNSFFVLLKKCIRYDDKHDDNSVHVFRSFFCVCVCLKPYSTKKRTSKSWAINFSEPFNKKQLNMSTTLLVIGVIMVTMLTEWFHRGQQKDLIPFKPFFI